MAATWAASTAAASSTAAWTWNPFAVGPIACAMLATGIAVVIWSGRVRARRAGPTYAPVAFSVGLWNVGVALVMCADDERLGLWLSRATLCAILSSSFFATRYAAEFGRVRKPWAWTVLPLLVAAVGALAVLFDHRIIERMWRPPWGGVYPRLGPDWPIFGIPVLALMVAPGLLIVRLRLTLPPSRRKRQAGYIFLAYLAASLGGVDILGALGWSVPPLTWATATGSVLIFYYAMARWRLLDTRTAVHRTLFWAIVVAASIVPLYGLAWLTRDWVGWHQELPRVVAVVLLMLLLVLYVARVEPLALGLIARRSVHQTRVASEFAARAANVRTPAELPPLVGRALADLAGLELVAVALALDAGGQRVQLTLPAGAPEPPVSPERAAPAEPLARGELDPDDAAGAEADAVALLDAYRADALLPLRHRDAAVGVLVCRRAHDSRVLVFDELTRDGLARLASRAAVAFINAALEEALARRSARLAEEVDERTRELSQAADELKAAQARLVQAERQSSLGVLVAGVSHEINNALNFIFGNLPVMGKYVDDYADVLARASAAGASPRPETLRRADEARRALPAALAQIEESAHRARAIVGDLRRFARADEAERRPTDLREGLESTLNLLAHQLGGRVQIERRIATDLPRVDGHPAALNHVFLNLLLNAAQAAGEQGKIVVSARPAGGGRVEIAISDSGPGVPEAARERVFEPFFTTRERAAGLGLTVSRQIIGRHGGDIRVGADAETGGARVTITLPVTGV